MKCILRLLKIDFLVLKVDHYFKVSMVEFNVTELTLPQAAIILNCNIWDVPFKYLRYFYRTESKKIFYMGCFI